ncbi:MAG: LptF/LptG family permease [Verrucomicrobia bacterium]|nr:LptF/LptG family permease [Verrucomicrobiota bacterium]
MPRVWRYLLRSYLQVFILCVLGFIGVLLVMRFKDIAEFATLHSDSFSIFLFTLYQIPYILPEAIPVACVISSMLLLQKMSHYGELTTLRASGIGLKTVLFPLLLTGTILSLVNFSIVSDLGPQCKYLTKELTRQMTASNPFFIFNKITEGKMKNAYVDMRTMRGGKRAKDVLLVLNNQSNGRLGIMTAKELFLQGDDLLGKDVTWISSVDSKNKESFDHLIIENQSAMSTKSSNLSALLQDAEWHTGTEYMPLRALLAKAAVKGKWSQAFTIDFARRLAIGLSPLAFTLMGAAFGMQIGRKQTKQGIITATLLCALFLCCFVGAKSMSNPLVVATVYFLPYPVILFLSLRALKKVERGIE